MGRGEKGSDKSSDSSDSLSIKTVTSEESQTRQQWNNPVEFILTLVGYAVGLGNVWRFPYLTYKNGGGAFLIPYFLTLVFIGLPVFFLEVALGQFSSRGPIAMWSINPLFKGLGISMVATNTLIAGYYTVIIGWSLFYFFASMTNELPWVGCDHAWNTQFCVTPEQSRNISLMNQTTFEYPGDNNTYGRGDLQTSTEEYFYRQVLRMSSGMEEAGNIVWPLACTLMIAWMLIFLVLFKGIGSLGKVVYFSSLFPYIIMTIMVGRGCTLPGAYEGIMYYLTPDWERLADPQVWSDAATQIFYSLSACSGGLVAMASYNDFNNNVLRDAAMVPVINCLTSFYSGFAIFSVLGFMAQQKGVTVEDVAASGPGLVFVVYPEGLQQLPVPQLWAVLFFFMFLTLGFSSVFSMSECLFSAIIDEFPALQRDRRKNVALRACGCICFFLFELCMITEGGFYVFNIIDTFTGGFPLLFVGLFEFIAISYVYGYFKFAKDVEIMLGKKPSCFFAATWMVISPLLLLGVIIFMAVEFTPLTLFDGTYHYPAWGLGIGWLVVAVCVVPIPLMFLVNYCKNGGAEVMNTAGSPTDQWGPAKSKHRKGTKYDRSTNPTGWNDIQFTSGSGQLMESGGDIAKGLGGNFNQKENTFVNRGFIEDGVGGPAPSYSYPPLAREPPPDYKVDEATAF